MICEQSERVSLIEIAKFPRAHLTAITLSAIIALSDLDIRLFLLLDMTAKSNYNVITNLRRKPRCVPKSSESEIQKV